MRKSAGELNLLNGRFSNSLAALGHSPADRSAVAVSGGGDSLALLHLLTEWTASNNAPAPSVLTVDHGLRRESAEECLKVKAWAAAAGLPAFILKWQVQKPVHGLEQRARMARYRLMGEWCLQQGTKHLFVAHTSDDVAETFLLRLGRGSGLDGLAAMTPRRPLPVKHLRSVQLLRPLLGFTRAELRSYLHRLGASWLEDPMNEDEAFARTRIRKLLPVLDQAGISPARIVAASQHLARARMALDSATDEFLVDHGRFLPDGAAIDATALAAVPREVALRALARALMAVAAREYRPRFQSFQRLFNAVIGPDLGRQTLGGCCIGRAGKMQAFFGPQTIWITRESHRKKRPQREATAAEQRAVAGPKTTAP